MRKLEKESDDIDTDDCGTETARKRVIYEHKFQVKWLQDGRFSSCLCKSKNNENKAFCTVCNCKIA